MMLKVARCGPLIVVAALALLPASHTFSSTSFFLSMPSRSSGGSLPGRAAQAALNVCEDVLPLRREMPHGANVWGEGRRRRRRNGDGVAGGAVFSSAQASQAPNFECVKNVRDLASVGNSPVKPGRCVLRLFLQEFRHLSPMFQRCAPPPCCPGSCSSFPLGHCDCKMHHLHRLHHANDLNRPPRCVRRILRAACVGTASEADECLLVDTVKTLVDLRSEQVISVPEILPIAPHMSIVTIVTIVTTGSPPNGSSTAETNMRSTRC